MPLTHPSDWSVYNSWGQVASFNIIKDLADSCTLKHFPLGLFFSSQGNVNDQATLTAYVMISLIEAGDASEVSLEVHPCC